RQSQSLVMTQALQQSIKLLQCTALELRQFVELELEQNPFLTQDEPEEEVPEQAESIESDNQDPQEANCAGDNEFSSEVEPQADWDDSAEIETDYLRHDQVITGSGAYDEDDERGIEDNPSQEKSLREHLLEQLQLEIDDPVKRMIGAHLIDL